MTSRVLRSHSQHQQANPKDVPPSQPVGVIYRTKEHHTVPLHILPKSLTPRTIGLPKKDLATLMLKRQKLLSPSSQTAIFLAGLPQSSLTSENLAVAARGTLVFAQHEAGTAVCIASSGLVITCAHCVAGSSEEYATRKSHCLIFSSGRVVRAECVAWDEKRDLALLRIVAAERLPCDDKSPHSSKLSFPFAILASRPPSPSRKGQETSLICIGHPGSEDLEAQPTSASSSSIPSNYDILHISYGFYRGLAPDQDVQDNSEIGALKHDCWTYWGHSGAPLIDAESGELIGLHSSWDEETGMRRGVGWEALRGFLEEWCEKMSNTLAPGARGIALVAWQLSHYTQLRFHHGALGHAVYTDTYLAKTLSEDISLYTS
jgi:hypothetical protein